MDLATLEALIVRAVTYLAAQEQAGMRLALAVLALFVGALLA